MMPMHIPFHIEDHSGEVFLRHVLTRWGPPDGQHTYQIHSCEASGRLPANLGQKGARLPPLLLTNLPGFLAGFVATPGIDAGVVIADLDAQEKTAFLNELQRLAKLAGAKVEAYSCLAIEEIEAWILGDRDALSRPFPSAAHSILERYERDSICGTRELPGEAVYPGGLKYLKQLPYPEIGRLNSERAGRIGEHLNLDSNASPSFQMFRQTIQRLLQVGPA